MSWKTWLKWSFKWMEYFTCWLWLNVSYLRPTDHEFTIVFMPILGSMVSD